jgi:hypothetical protein
MSKGFGKSDDWAPHGYVDDDGNALPDSQRYPQSLTALGGKFPIKGVISRIYYADSSLNDSNHYAGIQSTNTPEHEISSSDGNLYLNRVERITTTKGSRLEADVKIVEGPDGIIDDGTELRNVPVCIGFGGMHNYGFVVPHATTNVGRQAYRGTEDGDYCLVQFISGNWNKPIITNIFPNPKNYEDPAQQLEGAIGYTRISGTQFIINSEGDVILDAREAGCIRVVDPKSGTISKVQANGKRGEISLSTRSDIHIAAGLPRVGEADTELPLGNLALRATKTLDVRSTLDFINLNTQSSETRVDVQGERGSLRPAARKGDKVKIVKGSSDASGTYQKGLFEYLDNLNSLLSQMAGVLNTSMDPAGQAASLLLDSFVATFPAPTNAYGKIITGSEYCKIASKGTPEDVGDDENGITVGGVKKTPEELISMQVACAVGAASEYTLNLSPDGGVAALKNSTLSGTASSLKAAQLVLEKIPLPSAQVAATTIKYSSPFIIQGINNGFEAATNVVGAGIAAMSADVLSGALTAVKSSVDDYEALIGIRDGGTDAGVILVTGGSPPVNPLRVAAGKVEAADAAAWEANPNGFRYYIQEDLTDDLTLYFSPSAVQDAATAAALAGSGVATDVEDFANGSNINKGSVQLILDLATTAIELGAAPTDAAKTAAMNKLIELTGGSIGADVNTCLEGQLD